MGDPLDAQWEIFQKEIKMEAHKSEVIEEEEDDVMIYQRTLAEIDDQLDGWAKVEALHVKKEAKFIKVEIKEEEEEEGREAGGGVDGGRREESNETLNHQEVEVKVEPKEEEEQEEEE